MDLLVSAVAGDLVNRFVSLLINRCKSEENTEEKMERLQDLLLRVHMVVEEAEVRYITNSRMLLQLKKLLDTMYQGYHVLDTIKYKTLLCRSKTENKVTSLGDISVTTPIDHRFFNMESSSSGQDLQSTIDNLDSILSNMKEFVLLLEGCERMFRSPYDSYLYIDNFMFGRQVEKQQVINILLQDNLPANVPTVLPIIGGTRVGKKTLIAHVCNNEKVRSHFSSILHLNEENIGRMEHKPSMPRRCLVVAEFTSDVDDETWLKYYSIAKQMGRGSKIIIVSRVSKLSRFGTVKPIHLNSLTHEEYSYLFKVLAFGSTNPEEQPQMAIVAKDIAAALGGSLITANVYADMLRKNQTVNFWLNILKRYKKVVENNFSTFGEHPKNLLDKEHPIGITRIAPSAPSSSATLRLMPPHSKINKMELPMVMFGDLILGTAALPKEFELIAWESRIPPYKKFVNLATFSEDKVFQYCSDSPSKKRKQLDKVAGGTRLKRT